MIPLNVARHQSAITCVWVCAEGVHTQARPTIHEYSISKRTDNLTRHVCTSTYIQTVHLYNNIDITIDNYLQTRNSIRVVSITATLHNIINSSVDNNFIITIATSSTG
jgi:hypothetical protein